MRDGNTQATSLAKVTGRLVMTGTLVLDAPMLIGDGGEGDDGSKDIHVLKTDKNVPFIPGTSLCGVLREALDTLAKTPADDKLTDLLFGLMDAGQSMIQVEDVLLSDAVIGDRDGVSIDGVTGTGRDSERYDYECVESGARGEFRLTVTRRLCHEAEWPQLLRQILVLRKLLRHGISVGALTAKGFGRVYAKEIRSGFYDFHKAEDARGWLLQETPAPEKASDQLTQEPDTDIEPEGDFIVEADFALRTSLIIRDYGRSKKVPSHLAPPGKTKFFDAVSQMDGNRYVIPGTSLKGVLRHHAEHILRKLGLSDAFLRPLMGTAEKNAKIKSRLIVEESILTEQVEAAAQTRIRIDRLTGSVMDTALMVHEPLWQKEPDKKAVTLRIRIQKASDREIGLMVFLLRDLWHGKVAIGGEKSVGRGTLQGLSGNIHFHGKDGQLDKNGKMTGTLSPDVLTKGVQALLSSEKKEVG